MIELRTAFTMKHPENEFIVTLALMATISGQGIGNLIVPGLFFQSE